MRRTRTLAVAVALGTFVALGSACTDAGTALFILQNQVPGSGCDVTTALTSYNPRGSIDTNAAMGYLFTPVAQNVADGGENPTQRSIWVEGADIDLTLQEGLPVQASSELLSFSKQFSGRIEPDGGLTSFAFTIIPKQLLTELAGALGSEMTEVRAEVVMYGNLGGGGSVQSPPFVYWIDVCNGCMKSNVGDCTDLSESFTALAGGNCNDLQDIPLQCCTDPDGAEVCPAIPMEEPSR